MPQEPALPTTVHDSHQPGHIFQHLMGSWASPYQGYISADVQERTRDKRALVWSAVWPVSNHQPKRSS